MAMPSPSKSSQEETPKRVSPTEKIEQLLTITRPKGWFSIFTILFLLAALIAWSFVGKIPTEVNGKSVALPQKGVFSIEAMTEGTITSLPIKVNDWVEKGTPIATIYNPKRKALISEIKTTSSKIRRLDDELKILRTTLSTRTKLYKEGLLARTVLNQTKIDVLAKEIEVRDANAKLVNLFGALEETSSSGIDPYLRKDIQKETLSPGIESHLATLFSSGEGKVLEVLVREGDTIKKSQPVAWLEYPFPPKLLFYGYVLAPEANKIRKGMDVHIEVTNVTANLYGYLIGTVSYVSPYTTSEVELLNKFRNQDLVKYLTENGKPVSTVLIEPKLNPHTVSGFAWTSERGPPFKIEPGATGIIRVTVEEQSPISFLIPLWRFGSHGEKS